MSRPSKDVFNASQSGAMVPNLVSHEFKYLLEQLKFVSRGRFETASASYIIVVLLICSIHTIIIVDMKND